MRQTLAREHMSAAGNLPAFGHSIAEQFVIDETSEILAVHEASLFPVIRIEPCVQNRAVLPAQGAPIPLVQCALAMLVEGVLQ